MNSIYEYMCIAEREIIDFTPDYAAEPVEALEQEFEGYDMDLLSDETLSRL